MNALPPNGAPKPAADAAQQSFRVDVRVADDRSVVLLDFIVGAASAGAVATTVQLPPVLARSLAGGLDRAADQCRIAIPKGAVRG